MTNTEPKTQRHALRREGQRHDAAGNVMHHWRGYSKYPAGEGHALCSCGDLSPRLPSNAARKRWHREHKAEHLVPLDPSVMPPSTRVPGHSIVAQGAPHDQDGQNINRNGVWPHSVYGAGIGLCTCGLRSEVLPSAYARRKWHRDHRAKVWAELHQAPQSAGGDK